MFTLKLKIGRGMLEYQASDIKQIHKLSSVYGMLPEKCDCCQSNDLYLSYKSPKGNDYYSIVCKSCSAELNFHQKKDGGAFYIVQGEKMEVYQGPVGKSTEVTENNQKKDDDVPW